MLYSSGSRENVAPWLLNFYESGGIAIKLNESIAISSFYRYLEFIQAIEPLKTECKYLNSNYVHLGLCL